MVNKMIRDTFIEIAIIIIFVIASMFMWPILSKNWKDNLTNALSKYDTLGMLGIFVTSLLVKIVKAKIS